MSRVKAVLVGAAVLCGVSLATAELQEQSLGEVARQSRATSKKAVRVVTDDDIPPRPAEVTPAPEGPTVSDAQQPSASPPAPDSAAPGSPSDPPAPHPLDSRIDDLKETEEGTAHKADAHRARLQKETDPEIRALLERMVASYTDARVEAEAQRTELETRRADDLAAGAPGSPR
jgi:hypothetical protein